MGGLRISMRLKHLKSADVFFSAAWAERAETALETSFKQILPFYPGGWPVFVGEERKEWRQNVCNPPK